MSELLLDEVSDVLHHFDGLAGVVIIPEVKARPLDVIVGPDKRALVWAAGHVAEVLLKVVVAGGTGRLDQRLRGDEVLLEVPELLEATAEVLLTPGVKVRTSVPEDLKLLIRCSFGRAVVGTVQVMNCIATDPVLIVRVPATAIIEYTVTSLLTSGRQEAGNEEKD